MNPTRLRISKLDAWSGSYYLAFYIWQNTDSRSLVENGRFGSICSTFRYSKITRVRLDVTFVKYNYLSHSATPIT